MIVAKTIPIGENIISLEQVEEKFNLSDRTFIINKLKVI